MRIQSLHIGKAIAPDAPQEALLVDETVSSSDEVGRGFKSLQDFSITFEDGHKDEFRPTVIVGENGTGKTNLLEALVTIFRDLDLDERTAFAYTLKYECRGKNIHVYAEADKVAKFLVGGKSITNAEFRRRKEDLLPRHVFCYYSGNNPRLERLFFKHQNKHYKNSTTEYNKLSPEERNNLNLQRFFYAKTVHSQFVLLSFFSGQDESAKRFLEDVFGIIGLESVLFKLHKPDWGRPKSTAKGKPFERFWRSDGLVREFLENVYQYSVAPLELSDIQVPRDFRGSDKKDFLCLYLPDETTLKQLANEYASQREFFDALQSTYISDLLEDVRILLRSNRTDKAIAFSELSEGEQQLLTVFGLLRFTKQDDSLILLDEPDTHINPVWGWRYFELLSRAVEKAERSHFIMVTHDPLVISGLESEQVQILRRVGDGTIRADMPEEDPKGRTIGKILTSEMFGLRAAVDKETLNLLDEKRELARKPNLSDTDREKLRKLREQTRELELDQDDRDPEFNQWLDVTRNLPKYMELSSKDVRDKDDLDELRRLAREAAERLSRQPQGGTI
jgi:ABC-type lipoprotein export system ATPase subunit